MLRPQAIDPTEVSFNLLPELPFSQLEGAGSQVGAARARAHDAKVHRRLVPPAAQVAVLQLAESDGDGVVILCMIPESRGVHCKV